MVKKMFNNTMSQKVTPFIWVAFYSDGYCLPQFDLDNGTQHFFKEIDQNKLDKFGLFPISKELADKLGGQYYHDPLLSSFVLQLKSNQRLIGGIRRESQFFFTYSKCIKCGFEWQWMPNKIDASIGDAGLPRYGSSKYSYYIINEKNIKVWEVICPKCGVRNDLDCPDCHKPWNKIDVNWTLQCPVCKKIREKRTMSMSGQGIRAVFLLGWQETFPDGVNKKMIMFIFADGTFQLSDDFNAI